MKVFEHNRSLAYYFAPSILCFFCLIPWQSEDTDWSLAKSRNGISIYYRPSPKGGTLREMKIEMDISGSRNTFINYLRDEDLVTKWMQGLDYQQVSIINDNHWVANQAYTFPWPIANKFIVIDYLQKDLGPMTIIELKSLTDREIPSGYEEMDPYNGHWKLQASHGDKLSISYEIHPLKASPYPRWIQDPIIQRTFLNSFEKLRDFVESAPKK